LTEQEKRVITEVLHAAILKAVPKSTTSEKYGGVLYTVKPNEKEGQFCGIFTYKNHVQLSFANGTQLKDPANILEGSGKFRRHINFTSADEIDNKTIAALLKQSAKL